MWKLRIFLAGAAAMLLSSVAAPTFAACPAVNKINNGQVQTSNLVTATFTPVTDGITGYTTTTYTFEGLDPANPSVNGVPGLIEYCVYPDNGLLPDLGIVAQAIGADGTTPFTDGMAAKGSFWYVRGNGNPTNLPMDGNTYTMGTATWDGSCDTDDHGNTVCTDFTKQTILLHINDLTECQNLYGSGASETCFVFPGGNGPPPPACNGEVACKSASIAEADGTFDADGYPYVPLSTLLHIEYTYLIVNQPSYNVTMTFLPPTSKTQDINSGGGKDYFGCEQIPDPAGVPSTWGTSLNYQGTGFTLNFTQGGGKCNQSRFTLVVPSGAPGFITLNPGDQVTFPVDMITRVNKGGAQEYSSPGPHVLNSGFTVKWFQSGPSPACPNWTSTTTLCSFSTGATPLYVDAH